MVAIKSYICSNCSHKIHVHIEEKKWYRCHSIQTDNLLQCECKIYKKEMFKEEFSKKSLAKKMGL